MAFMVGICDDDAWTREDLKRKIFELKPDATMRTYATGERLLSDCTEFDMLFLDIEMPEIDGMEAARYLRGQGDKARIVFVTSHEEFMPEAFKVRAFRFFHKPISESDLKEALDAAEAEIQESCRKIIVNSFGTKNIVDTMDILYILADRKQTVIHMTNGEIPTAYPLKFWQERLDDKDFVQTHRACIVSIGKISRIDTDCVRVSGLPDAVPLSRRNANAVLDALSEYIERHGRIL
ncbi:MAG: LytTR family DNA-binding domain-containing protein [Clostridiales bacterium]|nr:LytTR family DNA-binding domain-containing protein [Clostridiales bacterium]